MPIWSGSIGDDDYPPEPVNAQCVSFDEVIPIEACLDLAERLTSSQHRWHSHVLTPDCARNPFPRYAIVIEDDHAHRVYVATSESFPDVDKDLVKMLHGPDIIDRQSATAAAGARTESPILDRVSAIDRAGRSWHHHMCFPACAFNPEPGRWTIEVEAGRSSWSESWDEEPADVLREIEVMFFNP